MKTILLFVSIVILFAPEKLWSQWECITPDTSAVSILDSLISYRSNFHPTSFDDVTLRVYFHVIRHSDSTGGYTYEEVQGTFNFLQSDFNDHGIFFAWDC